jgi:hypothetical protein
MIVGRQDEERKEFYGRFWGWPAELLEPLQ